MTEELMQDEREELKFLRLFKANVERVTDLSFTQQDDTATVTFRGEFANLFITMMAGWFRDCGGTNYVEMRAFHPETGPLLFIMQRQDGKTGNELRREAEDTLRLFCGPDQPIVHCDRDGAEIIRVEAGTLAKARQFLGIEV